MKTRISALLAVLLLALPLGAERIAELPELVKPTALTFAGGRLYVMDEECVHIYGLNPFRHIRTFGQRGQGPGEFNSPPFVVVEPGRLWVQTMGRLMTFTWEGEFLEDTKLPFLYFHFFEPLHRIGENYAGMPLKPQDEKPNIVQVGRIYGPDFKAVKDFYRFGAPMVPPPPRGPGAKPDRVEMELISDCIGLGTAEGKIFVGDTRKGFLIAVFDGNGEPLKEIRLDEPPLKVPESYKDGIWNELRKSPNWERTRTYFDYKMKDKFPAFSSFKVGDGRIYLTTFASRDGRYEFIVMDLEGRILRRDFVFPFDPARRGLSTVFVPTHTQYAVGDGRIYYLTLDEDRAVYTLHSVEIGM